MINIRCGMEYILLSSECHQVRYSAVKFSREKSLGPYLHFVKTKQIRQKQAPGSIPDRVVDSSLPPNIPYSVVRKNKISHNLSSRNPGESGHKINTLQFFPPVSKQR